jgi:hypothetical protein
MATPPLVSTVTRIRQNAPHQGDVSCRSIVTICLWEMIVRNIPDCMKRAISIHRAIQRDTLRCRNLFLYALLISFPSFALSGCGVRGAPSFVIVGSYFPGWMFCAVLGIVSAIAARIGFVASGLAGVLPFQLFVCTAIGLCCALLAWLLWFGQ